VEGCRAPGGEGLIHVARFLGVASLATPYHVGIRENLTPCLQQLLQVFVVGLTIGLQRTVIPALAESEFGVAKGSRALQPRFGNPNVAVKTKRPRGSGVFSSLRRVSHTVAWP
jgi:hypothetical protein